MELWGQDRAVSRGQQGLHVMGPVGRDWEFRLCPESSGEPGILIDRSASEMHFKKLPLLLCGMGLRGQTGDRKARQEAITAPRQENVGAWTGAGALEERGLVRD